MRAPLSLPLRRIVVASDLSDGARRAVEVALVWGAALRLPTTQGGGTELHVVHLVPRSSREHRAAAERELQAQVAAAVDSSGVGALLTIRPQIREAKSPVQAILDAAEEERTDLLVLGTHGRSALGRALVGSVSSSVARRTDAPVLLVPPGRRDGAW